MNGLDTLILVIYFSVLIVIGIIGTKKATSSDEFLLAGKKLGYFTHVGCLSAVIIGGASTLGSATLGFQYGISGSWFVIMIGLGIMALGLFIVGKISGYEVFTISQLLGKRYGDSTRLISAVVTAIYTLMIGVTQIIGMGTIVHAILGWPALASMLVGGGIVLFYTILGGMWSVTLTDIVQFVIMTVGIFFIMLPASLHSVGGFSNMAAQVPDGFFDVTNIGWAKIFQYFLLYVFGLVVAQDIWQRLFTAKNQKVAKSSAVSSGIYSVLYAVALSIVGMCALVLLPKLGDSQLAFTSLAMKILPSGLLGLVLASVCSALMSNASGALFASSTLITNDIIKHHFIKNMTDKQMIKISRVVTLVVGCLAIVFAAWIQNILVALDVAYDILSGAIFIPLVVGLFWKRATSKASLYSIIASTAAIFIGFAVHGLSSTLPIIYGIATSLVVIVTVTLAQTPGADQSKESKSIA
ncbi:sodium:solute symporter [Falsibacillus albus]|uniref:Sodium:solute symporter n=1 Tax=Falsibacillus albus TaxID=2478915 RepID=A0A3L7JTH1_9BACI|nr:sodium:solute symporter [Falsibacillus albus]RLQ93800.1 sodium:solute symporter [Falsibacillus albus]